MPTRPGATQSNIIISLGRARSTRTDGKRNSPTQAASSPGICNSHEAFDENAWELYNLNDDSTERIDLAKKYPEKLAELKAEFEAQAKAHNLYPVHHLG